MRAVQSGYTVKARERLEGLMEKSTFRTAAIQGTYFLCGIIVSHGAVFGSYAPFGASFCAAVPYRNSLAATLGSVIGYVLLYPQGSFRYVATIITIFALRWMLSDLDKITGSKLFAPLAAMVPLLCTGGVMIAVSYKGLTDVVMCVTEGLLAAVGAYFFSRTLVLAGAVDGDKKIPRKGIATYNQQEIACIVMTGCIFLLSANTLTVAGISVGRVLAVEVILFCAYYGSVSGGCIGGVATGIVFGIGSGDYGFIPASYGFGGLMAGLFSYIGRWGAVGAFIVCAGIVSLEDGVTAQAGYVFYETLIASVIFLFVPTQAGNRISSYVAPRADRTDSEGIRRGVIMRLDFASTALKGVSQAVSAVADKLSDFYSEDTDSIYKKSMEENCARCGMRAFCRKEEESRDDMFEPLTRTLSTGGRVDERQVKDALAHRCCKASEMAESINRNYENHKGYLAAQARVTQVRGVVAGQFSGLGDILGDLKREFETYETCDVAAGERVCAMLKANGFVPIECGCRIDRLGRMTVEIELADSDRRLLKKNGIIKEISRMCGRKLCAPQVTAISNRCRVVFSERPTYDVQVGTAQHICGSGTLCGDSFNYWHDGQGRLIAVVSDGMGTGGRAAVDAGMAVSIITKLLKAGLGFDCALSVANSALMVKSQDESLATVDIVSVDLFTGRAEIMKAGAPLTYVRRSGKVIKVEPTSLPAGILTDVKLSHDEMELAEGDIIIMVTDGAIAVSDGWIAAMLRDFDGDEIQPLVNDIIDEAAIGSRLGRDDDITVIGIRIF